MQGKATAFVLIGGIGLLAMAAGSAWDLLLRGMVVVGYTAFLGVALALPVYIAERPKKKSQPPKQEDPVLRVLPDPSSTPPAPPTKPRSPWLTIDDD